jgi:hypothetical protein
LPNRDPDSGVKLQRLPEIRACDREERCVVVMAMMMAESAGILDLETATVDRERDRQGTALYYKGGNSNGQCFSH